MKKELRSLKNVRTSSFCSEIDALQYYSIHSKSPTRRKQSMLSMFKHPLTPKTMQHGAEQMNEQYGTNARAGNQAGKKEP